MTQPLAPICDDAYFVAEYRRHPDGRVEVIRRLEEIAYDGKTRANAQGFAAVPLTLRFHLRNLPVGFHRPQIAVEGALVHFYAYEPWIQVQPQHHGEATCTVETFFPALVANLPFETSYEIRLEGKVLRKVGLRVIRA